MSDRKKQNSRKSAPFHVFAVESTTEVPSRPRTVIRHGEKETEFTRQSTVGLPPFYRVTLVDGKLHYDKLEEGSKEYRQVEKWVGQNYTRRLFTNHSEPRLDIMLEKYGVVTEDQALELLLQNEQH
jgi:hypothetical protein